MHTDRNVRRPSSEPVAVRPIVDRQTPVKTLAFFAVGNNVNICRHILSGLSPLVAVE